MVNGAWLDAQNFPPLVYAVPGIVPEGFGLLVAPPKAGKSWFVADAGLAVAAGGKALGRITVGAQRPVLYLALEDGHRRLQSRFRRIMADQPIPEAIHVIIRAQPYQVIPMIAEFLQRHSDRQPLIILDTLGRAKPSRPAGADPYQFDYQVGVQLKTAVDQTPGATLLVVHHTRKQESSDFVDSVSGTQGISGSADFVLVLARKRHSDEALLSVTGRDIPECEYALHADDGMLWRLDGVDLAAASRAAQLRREEGQLGDRALEVLAFVNERDNTRAADLAAIGIDSHQARTYLSRLAESGRIRKDGRGLYKSVASVASVASEEENATDATHATPLFEAPSGPGRCSGCGWHIPTQGHRDTCTATERNTP